MDADHVLIKVNSVLCLFFEKKNVVEICEYIKEIVRKKYLLKWVLHDNINH